MAEEHAVVIAGGGPTGLMLAGELALAGVDVIIIERRTSQDLDGSRAGGLHARSIEVLDQRGIADRFLAEGQRHPSVGYAGIPLDISDFPTRHPYVLGLWQGHIERLLADWVVGDLGVQARRGHEVVAMTQDDRAVDVEVSDGTVVRAEYLVGCDGGRSIVRKAAGIEFAGTDPSTSWLIAEAAMEDQPPLGMRPEGGGIGPVNPGGGGPYRIVLTEQDLDHDAAPGLDELRRVLTTAYGTDFGVHSPTWISRFTDMTRQAQSYRHGRVLLAGDAAHVHP
ncbi:MAG TPA: FAD-dependent monooxygenase, partial [Egibacteraceae bacterium]|nr:FAD-dependent monooxygenase [Egibacteraceae bacterium]